MTTILDSAGNVKDYGFHTHLHGLYGTYRHEVGVKAVRTTSVNPSAGTVVIQWQSVVWDTNGFIKTLPSNYITIPMVGWYVAVGYLNTLDAAAHQGQLRILLNDVVQVSDRNNFADTTASGIMSALNVVLPRMWLVVGDKISMDWDTNNASINMSTEAERGCTLAVWRVA